MIGIHWKGMRAGPVFLGMAVGLVFALSFFWVPAEGAGGAFHDQEFRIQSGTIRIGTESRDLRGRECFGKSPEKSGRLNEPESAYFTIEKLEYSLVCRRIETSFFA